MIAIGALVVGLGAGPVAGVVTSASATTPSGTMIMTSPSAFGTVLVVGSGKYAGYTLYSISGDHRSNYVCTATIVKSLPGGPGSCTGPSNDMKAEWPAITTTGAPVAGAGVQSKLLGSVQRPGIGDQVTYAGHPLYLFDQGPGQVFGEGWDEPSLPPWHGVWWTVSPAGTPVGWPETLTTTSIGGKTVLAAQMLTGVGFEDFPVYSYTKDTSASSTCNGSCAAAWPALITDGTSGLTKPLSSSQLGSVTRSDGTTQLTFDKKPLYLYSLEGIAPKGSGFAATGSGNGLKADGGTFELVTP